MLSLSLALVLSQAAAQPVDISAWKARAKGLTDGNGHFFVYDAEHTSDTVFYGDGKTMYAQRVFGSGSEGRKSWYAALWDPRGLNATAAGAAVAMEDSGARYTCTCADRVTPLTPLKADALAKLLDSATFMPALWARAVEKLLRDDHGVYYLVDRARNDRRDFRLFIGKRGEMKQVPLKDIVDDAQGMVFATRDGQLRLITGQGPDATQDNRWIRGKRNTRLTVVDLEAASTLRLVYMDLGPYFGQRLGTPCDDLL